MKPTKEQIQKANQDYEKADAIAEAAFEESYKIWSDTRAEVRKELEDEIKNNPNNPRRRFNFVCASHVDPHADKRLAANAEYQEKKARTDKTQDAKDAARKVLEEVTTTEPKERNIDFKILDNKGRRTGLWVQTYEEFVIEDDKVKTLYHVYAIATRNGEGFGACQNTNTFDTAGAREKYIAKRQKQTAATYRRKFGKVA